MTEAFQVFESNKVGLSGPEKYVVSRNAIGYLRILGDEPQWSLLTATASEDHGRITVCADQLRLVESALRLGAELETNPTVAQDLQGREYVRICTIIRESGESEEEFHKVNHGIFRRFFEIFDEYREPDSRTGEEMRELYDALATGEQDEDIYLSDGVWLSSDGSLHDKGR